MGSGKRRWKISFHTCPLPVLKQAELPVSVPPEFICPITGSIMADPVIIASGHTFERNCAHACAAHSFEPSLSGGDAVDFSIVIPNLALKSAILSWCRSQLIDPPKPIDFSTAERIVLKLIPNAYSPTNLTGTASEVSVASSDELAAARNQSDSLEEEEEELFVVPLNSCDIQRQEEALVSLRELTRIREDTRSRLSSPRLLSALKSLIASKSSALQVNAVAVLVNLSLDNQNKVKIVQSGMVPSLIKLLRCGSAEAQKHAAGAIFSLSLDDRNKTAIGVLGAFFPLLLALGSESERTRHDAAMALFHLSLVQTNHVKMIKLGFVPIMLGMVNSGHMAGRAMLILRNLAASPEGRDAMLDCGAVECLVSFLGRCGFTAAATTESCVAAMYGLSHGGLRFKGLAKVSAAAEVLRKVSESGSAASKEKAVMILEVLMEKEKEEEEGIIDWEELLLNSDDDRNDIRQRFPANSR